MAEQVDCIIVGAGVIGLAVARALAQAGRAVIVLEATDAIGTGISSRNSEVIHAGIYYPRDSLKARLCVAGREMLYRYCAERHIPHRQCGKLIVASAPAQIAALEQLAAAGKANGVAALHWLSGPEVQAREPALRAVAALASPLTGIIDSHAFMLSLQADIEAAGGQLVFRTPVTAMALTPKGITVETGGDAPYALRPEIVVNAAGLDAIALAHRMQGLPPEWVPRGWLAKGNYFSLSGKAPFSQLIYPVPEPGGLGIHLTLDLAGQARFGPDVEWVAKPDYRVDPARRNRFATAIRSYWPDLPEDALVPAQAGIRPKISGPDMPAADFRIDGPAAHGVPGLFNLFGIESPGLTSALALAAFVCAQIGRPNA